MSKLIAKIAAGNTDRVRGRHVLEDNTALQISVQFVL
jgi:hypothetical protein